MAMRYRYDSRLTANQYYADPGRMAQLRRPGIILSIVLSALIVIALLVTLIVAGRKPAGQRNMAMIAAAAFARHRPASLPMPPAGPPPGVSCDLKVPAHPLTARGLATPWKLSGQGCTMANPQTMAFVQATIISSSGTLSVYEPLVVDQGAAPAATPVVPTLPSGAVVTIDVGFNGDNLTLVQARRGRRLRDGFSLRRGNCVNGLRGSIFGQVSYCNAAAFYRAANAAIAAGTLKVPALGTASDGQPCPTTRSFTMVDQDQTDNVTTTYLLTANGQTAQRTAANAAQLAGAVIIANGSDNALLNNFIDPALGCTPFTVPDLTSPGTSGTSQALNELQAAAGQQAPVALVPVNDPMTEVNGAFSIAKTNLYRAGFDQPPLAAGSSTARNAQSYCQDLMTGQVASLQRDQAAFTAAPPPDPAVGSNLFTFLAARLSGSFGNLGCASFGMANPVTLTQDANGVATGAAFGTGTPTATASSTSPAPAAPTTAGSTQAAPTLTPTPPGQAPTPPGQAPTPAAVTPAPATSPG
jgi:hypothetical protein